MNKVTVLLPGGFKPPHAGHLGLVNKFAARPDVEKVIVMVGPTERDGITRHQSIAIWHLLPINSKVEVVSINDNNPMTAAFNYVFNLPPNSDKVIALGASAKNPDDAKRSKIFTASIERYKTKPTKDGNLVPKKVKAIEMTDDSPSFYSNRTDENNGKNISASTLRTDLANGDFENFKTNYPGIKTGVVKSIYSILKKNQMNEILKNKLKRVIFHLIKEMVTPEQIENAEKNVNRAKKVHARLKHQAANEKLRTAQERLNNIVDNNPEEREKAEKSMDSAQDEVKRTEQELKSVNQLPS